MFQPVVSVKGVRVEFGAVKALDGVDIDIATGEAVGLVGHNGAGKSTVVNVINGVLCAHQGTVTYRQSNGTGVAAARLAGIRCVFQELSLCPNLTVAENARLMHSGLAGLNWRARAGKLVRAMLDDIFPGNRIGEHEQVADLSIAKQQMVEIAINFMAVTERPTLVILDEPTSSLDTGLAERLLAYIRRFVAEGGSVIFISHILGEILSISSRIVVMKDGHIVASRPASDFTMRGLVETMGGMVKARGTAGCTAPPADASIAIHLPIPNSIGFTARQGEIVGLAGLAGHGQTDMLLELFRRHGSNWLAPRESVIAFVAGDRSLNGTFPLWSILRNLSISNLKPLARLGTIDDERELELGTTWKARMAIRTPDIHNGILSLSGGNQQKVLFARALAGTSATVLMDDPTRGVDIGTKQEVYATLRSEAAGGRTFVWYSTEMDEICLCDRVYVFRDGVIVAELVGDDITEEAVLEASFAGEAT